LGSPACRAEEASGRIGTVFRMIRRLMGAAWGRVGARAPPGPEGVQDAAKDRVRDGAALRRSLGRRLSAHLLKDLGGGE